MASQRVPSATTGTKPSSVALTNANKPATEPVVANQRSGDAPPSPPTKQAMNGVSRQTSRRQGSASRPLSDEEKLELAGRTAASAMGSDKTSRACVIL